MDKKQEIIKRVYTDEAGYGSKKETLDDARQVDNSITMNDVNEFFTKYKERKTNLRGYNSYVADAAYEEFHVRIGPSADQLSVRRLEVDTPAQYCSGFLHHPRFMQYAFQAKDIHRSIVPDR